MSEFITIDVEAEGRSDLGTTDTYLIAFKCTDPGADPTFDPYCGGDPGWPPEFEVEDIRIQTGEQNGHPLWGDLPEPSEYNGLYDLVFDRHWQEMFDEWNSRR